MDTSEKQIKRIVLDRMERCSVCHRGFQPDDIHVLSRRTDMWMMVVACAECHARNFVAAVLNDGDPQEAQLALRRLSQSDVDPDALAGLGGSSREKQAPAAPAEPPVSIDDVLDMHEFLNDFDGDFDKLFRAG
jgi:hypothetical protein